MSPFIVYLALMTLGLGAREETLKELHNVLKMPSKSEMNKITELLYNMQVLFVIF